MRNETALRVAAPSDTRAIPAGCDHERIKWVAEFGTDRAMLLCLGCSQIVGVGQVAG